MRAELERLSGQEVELTLFHMARTPAGGMRPAKIRGRVHSVASTTVYLVDERYGGMENALGGGLPCALLCDVKSIETVVLEDGSTIHDS